MPRMNRRSDEWSDDEIILALASCPRASQSYSPRHKNVIELADLIGRSRGAVSHRFANISHLIHGGTHGESHVSARTRELYVEFLGHEGELQAKASDLRTQLMAEDPTPRVEKEVSRDRARPLADEILAAAREAGLSEAILETYEREGSWHLGIMVELGGAFSIDPRKTTDFLVWLGSHLGSSFSRSRGYELGVRGEWQEIADLVIAADAPQLHVSELRPQDRITLALRLRSGGSLRHWKLSKKHLRLITNMNRTGERKRIAEYLSIDTSGLCDVCLVVLREIIERQLRTAVAAHIPP